MKKALIVMVAILGLAAWTEAGRKGCTTALVNAEVCRSADNVVFFFDLAQADATKLVNAIAEQTGWQATIPCTEALVTAGTCTQEQFNGNEFIPNPISKNQQANAVLRNIFKQIIRSSEVDAIRKAKQAEAEAAVGAVVEVEVGP